jgi:hypothetical protein
MTQISILKGIYVDQGASFRASYPRNLEPVVDENGISKGYLRSAPGIIQLAAGPGEDRGAINWLGVGYRVMGTSMVRFSGSTVDVLGDVGFGGAVAMDYSFDRLAINSGDRLYYYYSGSLSQVTDPDLGAVIDMMWIAGYFMVTDGVYVAVTELSDPFAVDPNKYGSAEADPDRIVALRKVRGEAYVLNRYTIENLQNVGGNGFPFQANNGGLIPKGCVGSRARTDFLQTFAFVGGARNEAISVYLAGPGEAVSISTPEIDRILGELDDASQASIELESRTLQNDQRLYVHLPDQCLVYSQAATLAAGFPVWDVLAGGALSNQRYPARHFTLLSGKWICGSPTGALGYLSDLVETHYGAVAGWEFATVFSYNGGKGAIIQALELVAATGSAPLGADATAFLSITQDGRTWGQERAIPQGAFGQTMKRLQWRPGTKISNYAGFKFRGANTAIASFARLEATIQGLNA